MDREQEHKVDNKYNLPKRLWKAINGEMYNYIMDTAVGSQLVYKHISAEKMESEHWYTICHNIAIVAALR